MPTPRRPKSEARPVPSSHLDNAREATAEALDALHHHNMTVAAEGRLDSTTDQNERSLLGVYRDLSAKTRSTTITGRSGYVPDLDDDEVDDE